MILVKHLSWNGSTWNKSVRLLTDEEWKEWDKWESADSFPVRQIPFRSDKELQDFIKELYSVRKQKHFDTDEKYGIYDRLHNCFYSGIEEFMNSIEELSPQKLKSQSW